MFEYQPADPADREFVPLGQLHDIAAEPLPVHFIFHGAFCRSTLLARALEIEGVAVSLSEPAILADLASLGNEARGLVAPLVSLLARRRSEVDAVFIKPTNHANRLIPTLMEAVPGARAILMTNPVAPFLQSVRKRGLMGHRWGRNYYLELQRDLAVDFGMSPNEIFAMSDLQTAGLAWLLNQLYFTDLVAEKSGGRIRTLDGDFFNVHRGETLKAVLNFCGIDRMRFSTDQLARHAAFGAHSKLGGAFAEAATDQSTAKEIEQVEQWIGLVADQLGLKIPVAQTLL